MTQYSCILVTVNVQMIFQYNLILRQRACFIGTKNINRAKVLDGIEILDDGFLFAHGNSALSQAGCNNHRQHLRRQSYGNRDAEQEGLQPIALGDAVDEEYQRNHNQHEAYQYPGNSIDTFSEARFHCFPGNGGCHRAK